MGISSCRQEDWSTNDTNQDAGRVKESQFTGREDVAINEINYFFRQPIFWVVCRVRFEKSKRCIYFVARWNHPYVGRTCVLLLIDFVLLLYFVSRKQFPTCSCCASLLLLVLTIMLWCVPRYPLCVFLGITECAIRVWIKKRASDHWFQFVFHKMKRLVSVSRHFGPKC
jgi:hypothetical protein